VYNMLDKDVGLAVEVLDDIEREIAVLTFAIDRASPDKAAAWIDKLNAKRAIREQLRAMWAAAAQLVQQRAEKAQQTSDTRPDQ